MTFQPLTSGKPVAKKAGDQVFIFRQRHHAVAQISWRQHVEAMAQPPAGASVVGHGDHRRQVGNEAGPSRFFRGLVRRGDVLPKSAQQGREASTPTDRHRPDAGAIGAPAPDYGLRGLSLGQGRGGSLHRVNTRLPYERKTMPAMPKRRTSTGLRYFGIQKFGEPGIVRHILKVGVAARLNPVAGA